MKNLFPHILFVLGYLLFSSCVEDNVAPPFTGQLNPAAEMLVYFESQGDFVNSNLAPALIDAQEVNLNLINYLIIDLRINSDFQNGHIEGAINISSDSLWNFMKSIDAASYPKIILISKNGQSSAYFTCLLRLAGYKNVYSMKYGMASWNQFFADEWLGALSDAVNISAYTNDDFPRNDLTDLPIVTFENPNSSLPERVNSRIEKIIDEGFQSSENLPSENDNYIVCYGKMRLYYARKFIVLEGRGHPPGARLYMDTPDFELRSGKYLQSLPTDKPISIYDYDGQLSACIAAYLRVLGYDASSLLFGANQLFYSRMIDEPDLREYAFSSLKINNFSYVTGE
ncbi:MAG: rhodanese-like domain-containing protein [Ignavibacteriaceae bacterium]|nr:rhodanese-like domain-containing protein [Ignavibacteriaceae bacterium]